MNLKEIFADDPEVLRSIEERESLGMMKELYKETLRTQQMNEAKQDAEIVNIRFLKGDKGDSPTNEELLQLITPLIPAPVNGNDGYTPIKGKDYFDGEDGSAPSKKELLALIKPLIPVAIEGTAGKDAVIDQDSLVDTIIEKIRKDKALDVSDIRNFQSFVYGGTKYKVSELMHGGSSSSGATTLVAETPTGTVDDSNVTFTVTHEPLYIVVNGAQYAVGTGTYSSYAAGTITLSSAVGTGGFIRSYYNA